jgi:endonuclease/exonuclease/phosphatase family metal-dependent hydrolase
MEVNSSTQGPGPVRLMTHNMLWDGLFKRTDHFSRVLMALQPDIICYQECRQPAAAVAATLDDILPIEGSNWHAYKAKTNVVASRWPLSLTVADTNPTTRRGQAMALVDLPDNAYDVDMYVISAHFKCCGSAGSSEDRRRQKQADANVSWFRDIRDTGGRIDLPNDTPIVIAGDFNIVGGQQPLQTLVDGNIIDETTYGPDSSPDWDGTELADLEPTHTSGTDTYTWRNDKSKYPPGRLDFVLYTDSVLDAEWSFVLNTLELSESELAENGLLANDSPETSDHLPIVVDFVILPTTQAQ